MEKNTPGRSDKHSFKIFGAAKPDAVALMSQNNISFYAGAECSPCIYNIAFAKKQRFCPDNPKCMENTDPEDIIKSAMKILGNAK